MKIMVLWDVMPHRVEDTLFQRNVLYIATLKIETVEPLKWLNTFTTVQDVTNQELINFHKHRIHFSYGTSYDTGDEESQSNDNKYALQVICFIIIIIIIIIIISGSAA
jgi:hypothetical protein